jgi:Sigma-70 region 2
MVEGTEHRPTSLIGADEAEFIKAARVDDANRFALLTERFRRELLAHCYRMLASYEDAQDLTQETFLRAWAKRESFQGRASLKQRVDHLSFMTIWRGKPSALIVTARSHRPSNAPQLGKILRRCRLGAVRRNLPITARM